MNRYALLLRGVNVGTKNSLPMAELRAMLEKLRCTGVKTYVQSGNAVFGTSLPPDKLTSAIEKSLAQYMGRPIATTLRNHSELEALVEANPFAELATDPAKLCVTFLAQPPTKAQLAPLLAGTFAPERFHLAGRDLYTWRPAGTARSPLAAAIEKLPIPGAITTRNWNTVTKLLEMLAEE